MLFGYFTLFVALVISAVAAYYSIVGLTAIFSAAVIPILIMGGSLEVGKVTAAVWLKMNWHRANITYKLYLVPAVAFLMLLTSMGIFGFLSKAHSDQSLVSGDSMAKVAIYDEKIKISRDNIDTNRKALKQMDEAVDQVMGRSEDEKGADKAVAIRRGQQKERARLLAEIQAEQTTIGKLNEERAPLAAENRKIESEVGPIKYIAALVYGDNPDTSILEKAVRLVIIIIVAVFDPLALVLILAAQQSIRWAKEEQAEKKDLDKFMDDAAQELRNDIDLQEAKIEEAKVEEPEKSILERHPYLLNPFAHFKDLIPMVSKKQEVKEPEPLVDTNSNPVDNVPVGEEPDLHVYDDERLVTPHDKRILSLGIDDVERPGDYITPPAEENDDEEDPAVKAAIKQWKFVNPADTLKNQRHKLQRGEISELPWMKLVADNVPGRDIKSGFGTEFPSNPGRGDTFVRVDYLPSVVYKYNGTNWMEVDKNLTDSYTYDTAYIDHLIDRISSGEYDAELLSDTEREQVAERLQQTNSNT